MPWVEFLEPFDWAPVPAVTVGFKAGHRVPVTQACMEAAGARCRRIPTPPAQEAGRFKRWSPNAPRK